MQKKKMDNTPMGFRMWISPQRGRLKKLSPHFSLLCFTSSMRETSESPLLLTQNLTRTT